MRREVGRKERWNIDFSANMIYMSGFEKWGNFTQFPKFQLSTRITDAIVAMNSKLAIIP